MDPSIEGFWAYAQERHSIWYKRNVLRQEPPWTDVPVLQRYKFCNVRRELDRGTIWYMENVSLNLLREDLLFRTVLYRLVNSAAWFEDVGGVPSLGEWQGRRKQVEEAWRSRMTRPPASQAYLTLPAPQAMASHLDRLLFIMDFAAAGWKEFSRELWQQPSLERFWMQLQELYGVGPFVAMQVYLDLFLAGELGDFSPNDFAYIGPGAWPMVTALSGGLTRQRDQLNWLRQLAAEGQSNQYEEIEHPRLPRLHLNDIQFSICEFRKFVNLSNGKGRKRYYVRHES